MIEANEYLSMFTKMSSEELESRKEKCIIELNELSSKFKQLKESVNWIIGNEELLKLNIEMINKNMEFSILCIVYIEKLKEINKELEEKVSDLEYQIEAEAYRQQDDI